MKARIRIMAAKEIMGRINQLHSLVHIRSKEAITRLEFTNIEEELSINQVLSKNIQQERGSFITYNQSYYARIVQQINFIKEESIKVVIITTNQEVVMLKY